MNRKLILAGAAAFVLAALALTAAYFYIPGGVRPSFGEGDVCILLNADGSVQLSWPEARLSPPDAENGTGGQTIPAGSENSESPEDQKERLSGQELQEDSGTTAAVPPENLVFYNLDVKSGDQHIQTVRSCPDAAVDPVALPMTVRIQAAAEGRNLLGLSRRLTSRTLVLEVDRVELNAPDVVGTPGPGMLSLSWKLTGPAPQFYEVFVLEEDGISRQAASTSAKTLELKVGRNGAVPLPSYDHPLEAHVRAAVQGEGYILCGPASNRISVERQDLLGDELNLIYREEEPRVVSLEWDETRGEYYEVYAWQDEDWALLDTLEPAEHLRYDLGRLGSGSRHRFRVAAKDANGTLRSSEEAAFFTSVDPLYATIWPIIDQPYYEQADQTSASLGKIPAGTALCVLGEQGDWFQIRYKDQYGWVDSRFCMINLPEYVGDHCAYDITNSYHSVFKVHEYPIALITDQVIQGFEHIQTEDGQFLVPYLYPCSKKLLSAAQAAEADGYRLKIYEAFRPNEATRFLYDTTAAQLDWAALIYDGEAGKAEDGGPSVIDPVTGWEVDLADGLLIDPETGNKISRETLAQHQAEEAAASQETSNDESPPVPDDQPAQVWTPQDSAAETPDPSQPFFTLPEEGEGGSLDPEEAPPEAPAAPQTEPQPEVPVEAQPEPEFQEGEPEEEAPVYETYFQIMTNNGRFHLGSFLARVTSAHNRGIALDLTLEHLDTGEELAMQSAIHDLSWYSAAYLNNPNAKLLENYMTAAGMRGLSSEWWHFQDDETREAIGLSSYLFKGVNLSGWTRDDHGWRYRLEDGSVLKNIVITVDGRRYATDRQGYVQDQNT